MRVFDFELVERKKPSAAMQALGVVLAFGKRRVLRTILHKASGHTYVVRYVRGDPAQIAQAKCYVCVWMASDPEHCPLTAADATAILGMIS